MWCGVFLLCSCASVCTAVLPIPPYLKPCARLDPNFNDCALAHAREAWPKLMMGDPKYNLPPLDPLHIEGLKVIHKGPKHASLTMDVINAKIHGIKNGQVDKIEYDFEKKHFRSEMFFTTGELMGEYKVAGRILFLPITGGGDVNITMDRVHVTFEYDFTLEPIDGELHVVLQNPRTVLEPSRVHSSIANLFNGNKLLGKQMNKFLNENWADVFHELAPTLNAVYAEVMAAIVGRIYRAVPYKFLFPDTLPS